MMAKMFYTLEEAKAALEKNEEEIKQFAREGRLREFRDGPRLMFKADQVESIKSELGLAVMKAGYRHLRYRWARLAWSTAAVPAARASLFPTPIPVHAADQPAESHWRARALARACP